MRIPALCTAILFALTTPVAHAQRLIDLPAGTMVRIETVAQDRFSGPLLNAGADTVRIKTLGNQPPVALASTNIRSYAIGAGKDRVRGALQGTAIGGGFGLVAWALLKSLGGNATTPTQGYGRTIAIVSTLLGVSIGTAGAPERWLPPRN